MLTAAPRDFLVQCPRKQKTHGRLATKAPQNTLGRMQSAIPSSPLPRAAMGPSRGTGPLSRAVCIWDAPCGASFGIHHPRWPGLSASLVLSPSTRWFFGFRRFYPVFTLKVFTPFLPRLHPDCTYQQFLPPFYPGFTPFWEGKMCRGKKEGKNGVNSFYPGVKTG